MEKLSLPAVACIVVLFCAAAAIASPAQTFTTLVTFNWNNGAFPLFVSLVEDPNNPGHFYGTTEWGGTGSGGIGVVGLGTIFEISPPQPPSKSWTLTTLYNFCSQTNCPDGANPFAGVIIGSDGAFYGTTVRGGVDPQHHTMNAGTYFGFKPPSDLGAQPFCQIFYEGNCLDGSTPYAPLLEPSPGSALYGTTALGTGGIGIGNSNCLLGCGTVFYTSEGPAVTYAFCKDINPSGFCTDGLYPWAGLIKGPETGPYRGLWGTTSAGGDLNFGVVFIAGTESGEEVVHSFTGGDGSFPVARLVLGTDGNVYGTTVFGGASNSGTVFELTFSNGSWTETVLHNFSSSPDGAFPTAGLVQDPRTGIFYGTTVAGGANGFGTLFQMTPAGVLTVLHSFTWFDGAYPYGGLVQGKNGRFYGTTYAGAFSPGCPLALGCGTVFVW
ncbi:MAG: choice-of-anchor tandem repeat GloVer-containing protein [Terriglobales bacterium]